VSSGRKKDPGENPTNCIVKFFVTSTESRIVLSVMSSMV
jgi:hypothetical protein